MHPTRRKPGKIREEHSPKKQTPHLSLSTTWKEVLLALIGSVFVLMLIKGTSGLSFPIFLLTFFFFGLLLSGVLLSYIGHILPHRYLLWIGVSSATLGGIYLLGCNAWVSVIGDNIVYIRDAMRWIQGKALLDTQYGVGLKGMLVPVLVLFPGNVTAMNAVVALTGILFPLFTFLAFREFTTPARALVIALLSGIIPVVVDYSHQVVADLPYASFSVLALYITLRYIDQPGISWKWLTGASCAIGWAYHVKAPAMVVMLAAVIFLLLRRQVRKAMLLLGGTSVWIVPWLVYLRIKHPGGVGYFSSMYTSISRGEYMPDEEIGTFWHNFFYYLFNKNPRDYINNVGQLFFPFNFPAGGWLVLVLIIIGFLAGRKLRSRNLLSVLRSIEVHDWYLLGYMAMLFTLPGAPLRYVIPALPFLVLYLLHGFEAVVGLSHLPYLRRAAPAVLAVGIFLSSFHTDIDIIAFQRSQEGYPGYWGNYYTAALWIRDHTPPESQTATRKPTLVWFWSGRESEQYPWTKDIKLAWQEVKRFDYVIVDNLPFFPETQKYLVPLIQAYPDSFEVVYTTPQPQNYVLKVKKN